MAAVIPISAAAVLGGMGVGATAGYLSKNYKISKRKKNTITNKYMGPHHKNITKTPNVYAPKKPRHGISANQSHGLMYVNKAASKTRK